MPQVSLDNIRHSLAHVLALAVKRLYKDVEFGVGPVTETGFFYDFKFPSDSPGQDDLGKIEKEMKKIIKEGLEFEHEQVNATEAKKILKNQPFKHELIDDLSKYGTTEFSEVQKRKKTKTKVKITLYTIGEFIDLCRGGHVEKTSDIDPKSFKLTNLAGAYWRGSERNPQMTRIYGAAFANKKELEKHLEQVEEAKKRDHRVLGKQLGIFTFAEEVGQGLPLWLPKGTVVRDELERWAKETEEQWGYKQVITPHITKEDLYKISGHLPYYADNMYTPLDIEGSQYYLKPMNCPHHHMIYKSELRSYRDLPLRVAEYGQLYRFEISGALHGIMRTRGFCQNDAHIYVAEKDVVEEFVRVMELHKYYYDKLGIKDFKVKLGLRDPQNLRKKYHGDDKTWEKAEKLTREGLEKSGVEYTEDIGGAAHYGPKGDIIITSVIGKEYAIGTVQVDLYMPERFDLSFINEKGEHERPVIIHRAPLGSHERMIGFLLEHFAGAFPTWLSPVQAVVLPVGEKYSKYAGSVVSDLKDAGIRAEIDDSDETLGKRIRNAELQKVPYILVVGEKEEKEKSVNVRSRLPAGEAGKTKKEKLVKLSTFTKDTKKEIAERSL